MQIFDVVIIGSGPGGYIGAIRAAQLGLKTAVIEKSKTFGGTCLNVGCIPSKALLESSEHYDFTKKNLEGHGVSVSHVKLDLQTMMNRKNKVVTDLTQGIQFLFKKNKISTFEGVGKIKSKNEIEVTNNKKSQTISAKNIIIATGSMPVELPFAKWNQKTIVSSTEALSFKEVPKKLIVVGGGYIGLELGSVWNRLGSEVTVVEFASSICSTMDKDIQSKLFQSLKKQGLQFYLNSKVTKIEGSNNEAELSFTDQKTQQTKTLKADKILVCVGRRAFTQSLGLENVNIQTNKQGQIEVDQHLRTSASNIFAIGDVIAGPMLAHKAEEEGVAVAEWIAKGYGHVHYETVPSVIYTWPEASSVGKTEEELKNSGQDYNVGAFPFLANGRAKALGCTEGFIKILADKKSDEILGVHIFGPRAGDLISEAVVAMEFKASSEDLARSFHAHPSLSEVMREAALAVNKQARQM